MKTICNVLANILLFISLNPITKELSTASLSSIPRPVNVEKCTPTKNLHIACVVQQSREEAALEKHRQAYY